MTNKKKNKESRKLEILRVFKPLMRDAPYKGAYGGRGSGKSQFFAMYMIMKASAERDFLGVCVREVQKSIRDSVHSLLVDTIHDLKLDKYFIILRDEIRTQLGGRIIFYGMQSHNNTNIQSVNGIDVCWVEEAQSLSQQSLDILIPTVRDTKKSEKYNRHSEIWFSWNPKSPKDAVDKYLRSEYAIKHPKRFAVVKANYKDNKFFPEQLDQIRKDMEHIDPGRYAHIWLGDYLTVSDAQIFKDKFRRGDRKEFNPSKAHRLYYGVDWGFAKDPTVLVRCYIFDNTLYIDYSQEGYHIPYNQMIPKIFSRVPGSTKNLVYADNSEPRIINHLRSQGLNIVKTLKSRRNSIEEGLRYLCSFDEIVIHPDRRCDFIFNEMVAYSYKIDKQTDEILPEAEDKNNHSIDALRYALNRKIEGVSGFNLKKMYKEVCGINRERFI